MCKARKLAARPCPGDCRNAVVSLAPEGDSPGVARAEEQKWDRNKGVFIANFRAASRGRRDDFLSILVTFSARVGTSWYLGTFRGSLGAPWGARVDFRSIFSDFRVPFGRPWGAIFGTLRRSFFVFFSDPPRRAFFRLRAPFWEHFGDF